jgi:hypothetical protein
MFPWKSNHNLLPSCTDYSLYWKRWCASTITGIEKKIAVTAEFWFLSPGIINERAKSKLLCLLELFFRLSSLYSKEKKNRIIWYEIMISWLFIFHHHVVGGWSLYRIGSKSGLFSTFLSLTSTRYFLYIIQRYV